MSAKNTLLWVVVAAGLFAFIFFYQAHVRKPTGGPAKVLPELRAATVTSIQVRPAGPAQLLIRAERTNQTWQLTEPQPYPAQSEKVEALLEFLQRLTATAYITGGELRNHTNADEEYGFSAPQATLLIQQDGYRPRLLVGALTNPGDQVFLQVEGDLGAFVVDAELLKHLPRSANDWRDTALASLQGLTVDRVSVTNNAKGDSGRGGLPASSSTFVLQCDPTNRLWRMVWPLDARANRARIEDSLKKLQGLRIHEFVSDDPKPDLDALGLASPELELGFSSGTNGLMLLQFGRSPTNDPSLVYARRPGQTGFFAVGKEPLLTWCAFLNDFRDPQLLALTDRVDSIEMVHGQDVSSVQHLPDDTWRGSPGDFPVDSILAKELLSALGGLRIVKFVNDVVNPPDLPDYGLALPAFRLILKAAPFNLSGGSTNTILADLSFGLGTNRQDKVFVKRADENFVYAIATNDFTQLPLDCWRLRERRLWHFSEDEVAGVTIRQQGKTCGMIRSGTYKWSLAPGSQGLINPLAVEETVRGVTEVSAVGWVARGQQSLSSYGFQTDGYQISIELKSGEKFDIAFAGKAPSSNTYAAVTLDGQPWILEFPWNLYRDVSLYLSIPANP